MVEFEQSLSAPITSKELELARNKIIELDPKTKISSKSNDGEVRAAIAEAIGLPIPPGASPRDIDAKIRRKLSPDPLERKLPDFDLQLPERRLEVKPLDWPLKPKEKK
jgi:hypothetical protein